MLEQEDLKKIGEVVEEKIKKEIGEFRKEMKDEFVNVYNEFANVRKEMKDESKKIIEGVCEFVEQNILPAIDEIRDELKRDIAEVSLKTACMVNVDYLDDKLYDLKGDIVVLTRKEDKKVIRLVEILQSKNILTNKEAKELFMLEPFVRII